MANSGAKKAGDYLYSVYAGGGWYLRRCAKWGGLGGLTLRHDVAAVSVELEFDTRGEALAMGRDCAVKACHAARAAGVPSWIVRHPALVAA